MEALRWAADVLFSWKRFHILAAAVIVFEVIACAAAIRFVPCECRIVSDRAPSLRRNPEPR